MRAGFAVAGWLIAAISAKCSKRIRTNMPNARTHDAVTVLLTAPAFAAGYTAFGEVALGIVTAIAFIFGGLMFGPDLDTTSKQYSRWGIFRFVWKPYSLFFPHRSRWSHGLMFGTLFRVIYFMGVLTLAAFAGAYFAAAITGGEVPSLAALAAEWRTVGSWTNANLGLDFLVSIFGGMWLGAASHTLTDMAGTFIKTGRVTEFF